MAPLEQALRDLFGALGKTITPGELRVWLDALSDLTPQQIRTAIQRFNREYTGFPTPSALRKCSGVVLPEDRAAIAWEAVSRAVRSYGAYGHVNFSDAIANAAVRLCGGWVYLCSGESGTLAFRRKEFLEAYERVLRTGIGDGSPLRGIPMDIQPLQHVVVNLPESKVVPQGAIEHQPNRALVGIGAIPVEHRT